MDEIRRRILVVEHDPAMRADFIEAFLRSGYYVQVTESFQEAVAMIRESNDSRRPFDLVLMDISDKGRLWIANGLQWINATLPVFMLRDAADKLLIIDLLSRKRKEFLEKFIEMHAKAL